MKLLKLFSLSAFCLTTYVTSPNTLADQSGFVEGGKVYALANIHADFAKNHLYAMNYQLPKLIPICSEFVIDDIGSKEIELTHQGANFNYIWDKYTRKGGQSLEENFKLFFGKSCEEVKLKIKTLSKIDQEGIEQGKPLIGMSKEGILFAMGRPPIHANPSLDANTWVYWTNKWIKEAMVFDNNGKVKSMTNN